MPENIVVFIHGFMGSPAQFEFLTCAARDAGWEVCLPVLPGHGGDVKAFVKSNKDEWLAAVDMLLDELRLKYKKIALVGHSMGGLLSINAWAKNPDRIAHITALALPLYLKITLAGLKIRLESLKKPRAGEDVRVTAARRLRGVSGITLFNSVLLLPNTFGLFSLMRRTRERLRSVQPPLSVINSGADEIVSPRSARLVELASPQSESIKLTQSSHFWFSAGEQDIIRRELSARLLQIARQG